MAILQEMKGRFFLTIPKEYVKLKKWHKGTEVVFGFDQNGDLVLKEIKG